MTSEIKTSGDGLGFVSLMKICFGFFVLTGLLIFCAGEGRNGFATEKAFMSLQNCVQVDCSYQFEAFGKPNTVLVCNPDKISAKQAAENASKNRCNKLEETKSALVK